MAAPLSAGSGASNALGAFRTAPGGPGPRSPFPPIADYGFLSDCRTNALVASSGGVEWLCLPRPDAPSVFGAMLDRSAGEFRLGPADVSVPAGRRYLPGTNVLETTWQTRSGWLVVRDALSIGPWHHEGLRSSVHRRTPTDTEAEGMLVRTVECVNGSVELRMSCEPVYDYGRRDASWAYTGEGYDVATGSGDPHHPSLQLVSDLRIGFEGRQATARTLLREGDTAFVALSWGDAAPPRTHAEAEARIERTADFWRGWLNQGRLPDHPMRIHLQRSALTLKGLTYAPTGAMIAAATTSLPEAPGGQRNWDYRYTWIRDSSFMLWGLYTLGFDGEADDFFAFVADLCHERPDLQVLYGVEGERELDESTLDHLSGYEGARPVRVGNDAYAQQQNDIWGMMTDAVYLHARSREYLPERIWPILVHQVETARARWREPDRGIWEVRGQPRHFTSSKLMCWVALERGARLADLHGQVDHAERWRAAAGEVHDDLCAHGVDRRGVFRQHYESDALDASTLLIPLMRFLPADDPRVRATVLAVADELTVDGLVLRYRPDETDDGLGGAEEGTFTICSFWLVSALAEIGEVLRARRLGEKLLSYASPLGLYAEEVDPRSGRHLGNFPQAFTHLALINAVMHLVRADEAGSGLAAARDLRA